MFRKIAPFGVALLCTLFLLNFSNLSHATNLSLALKNIVKKSEALTPAPLLSRKILFQKSKLHDVQLSPFGHYLSYQENHGTDDKKRSTIWLFNIKKQQHEKLFTTNGITDHMWAKNGKSLFINLSSSIAISRPWLNKSPMLTVKINQQNNERFLGLDPSHADSFLVRLWDEFSEEYVVNRINDKGKRQEIYRTKRKFRDFGVDSQGKPLFLTETNMAIDNKGEENLFDISNQQKQLIWQCPWDDPCDIYYYDKEKQRLLMKSNYRRNFSVLAWLNLTSKDITPLHSDPQKFADLHGIQFNHHSSQPDFEQMLLRYHGDYLKHYAFNTALQQHINQLEQHFPKQSFTLQFPDRSKQQNSPWLVTQIVSTFARSRYFLYHPQTKQLTRLKRVTLTNYWEFGSKQDLLFNQTPQIQ